jgi:hypothetical protein
VLKAAICGVALLYRFKRRKPVGHCSGSAAAVMCLRLVQRIARTAVQSCSSRTFLADDAPVSHAALHPQPLYVRYDALSSRCRHGVPGGPG